MPITMTLPFIADLAQPLRKTLLSPAFLTGDDLAHCFQVELCRGSEAVSAHDATVTAYFIRPDGATVTIVGQADTACVSVTLSAACYAVPGRFSLVIRLTQDNVKNTVFWAEGTMTRSATDTLVDDSAIIPSLDDLLAQIEAMETATAAANEAADAVMSKLHAGELDGKGLQILGYYATADALAAGVVSPQRGDAYGVGTAYPYDVYVWDALHGVWVNNGPIQGPQGETGPQGPQGEPGTDGRNGADARHNLLDNSCWERPGEIVNQRGESSYTGAVYGIDRWRSWTDTNVVTISADCLSISGEAHLAQYIDPAVFVSGRAYTFAVAKKDGTVRVVSGTCPMTETAMGDGVSLRISDTESSYVTITEAGDYVWAALYEGEYTADALPPYIPKGYTAELLACMRYFQIIDGHYLASSITVAKRYYPVNYPLRMRIAPTVTITEGIEYQTMTATGAAVLLDNSYKQMSRFACTSNITSVTGGLWVMIKAQLSADL